jgi:hypothetical protein
MGECSALRCDFQIVEKRLWFSHLCIHPMNPS